METLVSAPQRCVVCRDERIYEINRDLMINNLSIRKAAEAYGYAPATIQRHKKRCIERDYDELISIYHKEAEALSEKGKSIAMQDKVAKLISGAALVTHIDDVIGEAENIHDLSMKDGDLRTATQALNTKLKAVDSFSKVAAEAREREKMKADQTIRDWNALRGVLRRVLSHYPGALEEFERESTSLGSSTLS
ncbi:MAG: hypothetical protein ACXQS5_06270 [Candidatus Methanospirareceae archaeon]